MAAASSGALESAPAVTTELSVCRGLDAPGVGATDLLSLGQECPCSPGPSRLLPVPWGALDLGLSPQHPVLPGLCCWIRAPGRAAPSAWSLCLSPSELLPGPAVHALQLFRELRAFPPGRRCLLVSQGA